jgi:hypothetical protein
VAIVKSFDVCIPFRDVQAASYVEAAEEIRKILKQMLLAGNGHTLSIEVGCEDEDDHFLIDMDDPCPCFGPADAPHYVGFPGVLRMFNTDTQVIEIQRCDSCELYESDDKAKEAYEAYLSRNA